MAKSRRKSRQQSRSAYLLLLILIVALPLVAGFFFKDYREVPYGWILTIIWLMASFFAFGFGIIYFGQFVLPHHEGESWLEGVNMLLRSATHSGPRPVRSRKAAEYPGQESLPTSFDTLRAGILRSYQVLALSRGARFVRAAGPGFVRLADGERISQLLDLRNYARGQEITANTRDGIPLVANVKVVFRIKQPGETSAGSDLQYPYDENAVFQVSQASSVDQNNETLPWTEQLAPQAASYVVSELSQFTLNELSQEPNLLSGIQRRVRRQLRANFDSMGIRIFDVGVTMQDLPQEIVQQRLANWRAPWESEVRMLAAATSAESLRRIKHAQAKAQVEIIQKIMASISELRQVQNLDLPRVVNLRVIEAMEEAMSSNALQARIPGQVFADMVLETSALLEIPRDDDSGETREETEDGE